jgi:methionine synthase II (cobalamin-independent)
VPYNNLLPEMFKINAGYFLIQLASEREKDPIYESIGEHSRDDQMVYLGVTNPGNPRPESPQEICNLLVCAADFIPKERCSVARGAGAPAVAASGRCSLLAWACSSGCTR